MPVKSLSVIELATLLERNKHKFIFLSYYGGMGGEFIMNFISDNSPSIINQKDATLMTKTQWPDIINIKDNNKFYFPDTIFCHYFLVEGLINVNLETYKNATTFNELAEKIMSEAVDGAGEPGHLGYEGHDFNALLELDKYEDMRYLVKVHHIYDELKLFKDSKIIRLVPNNWKTHCALVCKAKNETLHMYSKEDKKKMISYLIRENDKFEAVHEQHSKMKDHARTSEEQLLEYFSDIIENDNIPLYEHVIRMATFPRNFDLDLSKTSASELNSLKTIVNTYMSEFLDDDYDDGSTNPPITDIEFTEYEFNELANGRWITKEFGLDAKEFKAEFTDWYRKNIELLNSLGFKNHFIPTKSFV